MTDKEFYANAYGGIHGNDIFTPLCRIAFVELVNPNTKFVPHKYGCTLLADKKDETVKKQLKEIQTMCTAMAEQMIQASYAKLKGVKPELELYRAQVLSGMTGQPIFRDGDTTAYEGFAGHWALVCKNKARFPDKDGFIILNNTPPEAFVAGMLVRAQVQPYCDPKGFSYKLRGLNLVKDDGLRYASAVTGVSLLAGLDEAVAAVKVSATPVTAPVASVVNELDVLG